MNEIAQYSLLIGYCLIMPLFGFTLYRRWLRISNEPVFDALSSILIGILVSVPATYLLSWRLGQSNNAALVAVLLVIIGMIGGSIALWKKQTFLDGKQSHISIHEVFLLIFTFVISFWMMQKSFRVNANGTWLVASNTVFDVSHELSVVRSFSFGHNIPFTSPFAAGYQEVYHFFFYYLVAVIEQLGVNLPMAFTVTSAIGFQLYLLSAYYFSFLVFKKSRLVGWLTIVLLLCNSSFTWLLYGLTHHTFPRFIGEIWHLATYPFNGPYDGSTISLFFTLNVFVNQRHLAYGLAIGVWLFTILFTKEHERKQHWFMFYLIGCLIGLSILWNIVLSVAVMASVVLYLVVQKKYRGIGWIALGLCSMALITCGSYIPDLIKTFLFQMKEPTDAAAPQTAQFTPNEQLSYWVQNLGIAPLVAVIGFFAADKKTRRTLSIYIALFIVLVITLIFGKNIIYQKLLNFWYVGFAATTAYGLTQGLRKKQYRIISIVVGIILVISGCIDLMVIKNDFAYPAVSQAMNVRITKLHALLPTNAIVLSYQEMFHEVALAGRKQYIGYFASPAASVRLSEQQQVFTSKTIEELTASVKKTHVTHLYLPKKSRNDFPYNIDLSLYRKVYRVLYEDDEAILFAVIQ